MTALVYFYVCLHIQRVPSFLQITLFVEQQSAGYPSQRLHFCCNAGWIPEEGEFQGLIMSIAHTKVTCFVLLFKVLWKYSCGIPCLFILVISRLELMIFSNLRLWPFFTTGYKIQAGSSPTLLLWLSLKFLEQFPIHTYTTSTTSTK